MDRSTVLRYFLIAAIICVSIVVFALIVARNSGV